MNARASAAAERRGRIPVLGIQREDRLQRLVLENVGNGPAMNIIFTKGGQMTLQPTHLLEQGHPRALVQSHSSHAGSATRNAGCTVGYRGRTRTQLCGMRSGRSTVKASDYGMVVLEGLHLPDWDMREAKYVSELGDARPEGHHWGERQTVRRLSARL